MHNMEPKQAQILKELEMIIEKNIPIIDKIDKHTFGVKFEVGNIIGLSLYNMGLSIFPELITKLVSLKYLDLESNELTTLPESIVNLKSLQKLNLAWNELTTLPNSIVNLYSLQKLYVAGNKFTSLPGNRLDSRSKAIFKQLKENGVKIHIRN